MKNNYMALFIVFVAVIGIYSGCKRVPFFAKEGATLILSSNKTYIKTKNDYAIITVIGFDSQGGALHDHTTVYLLTSLGVLEPSGLELLNGKGTVIFSSSESGVAKIYARSGSVMSEPIEIKVGRAALESLSISANPSYFEAGGGTSKIEVMAFDKDGNLLSGIPVVLSVSGSGSLKKGGLQYTDNKGKITDYLTVEKTSSVKATSGSVEAAVEVKVEEEKENNPPVAGWTYSPQNPYYEETIYFNGSSSSDSDGYIVSYEWDFGDGSSGRGVKISHKYTWNGSEEEKTFSVTLKVIDDKGASDVEVKNITIKKR